MKRLKRAFSIDIEQCEHCGGRVKVIASIEESLPREHGECIGYPTVIALILNHLKQKQQTAQQAQITLAPERGPRQGPGLFS